MTIIRWHKRPVYPTFPGISFKDTDESNLNENCGCLPDTNIRKFQDQYRIDMALPGLQKQDIAIKLEENTLTISYQKKEETTEQNQKVKYIRKEFEPESFERHFTLPESTEQEKITANFENGVLSINIPFEDPEKHKISRSIHVN